MMTLTQVNSRRDEADFLKVPYIIYKHDKNWIPHLEQDISAIFDPLKNPLCRHGQVVRWVLRNEKGALIGRVAAFINPILSETFEQPTGGMGFFECINDQKSAFLLFDQCRKWLEERGMKAMDGPINFGEKERFWGLRIEGFEQPPTYLVNYNPPYYRHFFEAYGFKVFYHQYIYRLQTHIQLPEAMQQKFRRLLSTQGFHFETLKLNALEKFADDFCQVYNESWSTTHRFFRPMKRKEALKTFQSMKSIIDEDLVVFGYQGNRPIAMLICIPELNTLFRYVNGRLNLLGKIRFLYHKLRGKTRTIQGLAFGVVPEFRNKGVESGLILSLQELVVKAGKYDDMYMNWIGDFNPKMIRIIEYIGSKKAVILTTYRLLFDPGARFERHPLLD